MKPRTCKYFILLAITGLLNLPLTYSGFSQVLRMDLPSVAQQADLIVNASVVSIDPRWVVTAAGKNIITTTTFSIIRVIKGTPTGNGTFILETPGGTIGDTTQFVTSCVNFSTNEETILFLNKKSMEVVGEYQGKYSVFENSVQIGRLLVDKNRFIGILRESIESPEVLPLFLTECLGEEQTQEELNRYNGLKSSNSTSTPVISSISPDKASAGTKTDVTISGFNFGNIQGAGRVEFFYQSGLPKIQAPIVSWSDNQIICKVPINSSDGKAESAASGPVTVINSTGLTSNQYIFRVTFGYGQIKWPSNTVFFRINENLTSLDDEGQAVRSAADTWNNTQSGFTFQYIGSHSNTEIGQNNTNEIMWGAFSNSATIGRASIWTAGGNITECDIKFNQDYLWSSTTPVPNDRMDIQSVALHELGHWLNLRDLYGNLQDEEYDKAKVMYGFGYNGMNRRSFHPDDIDGIKWIYGTPATFTISGYVRSLSDNGIQGVELTGLPGNTSTNSNGYYTAIVDNGWSGTVTPVKTGYSFTPLVHTYINQSDNTEDQNFTGTPWSTDATLSDLKINGITIAGFSPAIQVYSVELLYGTTAVPLVTATTNHLKAGKVITNATSLPGYTTILVTAEDGTTSKIYTVNFTVAKNNDATLADLLVSGTLINGFNKSTLSYSMALPYGTTDIPAVTAKSTDPKASVQVVPATTLPGVTLIQVTAENGFSTLTYSVNFTLIPPSVDATLSNLKTDEITIDGFSPAVLNYPVELPYRTLRVPVVSATVSFSKATMKITQATSLPGTSTVEVTAEDGITSNTYSVIFTVAKNTDATLSDLMIDGLTIEGFSGNKHDYQRELPFGTVKIPLVNAITNDGHASLVITPPESLPGTTHIHVTAEDGSTAMNYSVEFTLTPPSEDAALSDFTLNGTTIVGFRPDQLLYNLEWPHGMTTVPQVRAVTHSSLATAQIQVPQTLPGTIAVTVTAQDGVTKLLYQAIITLARSNEATLSDLKIGGVTIDGFLPEVLNYMLVLPFETVIPPVVTATPSDENARLDFLPATQLPGISLVKVTAEDGTTVSTYEIHMRYPLSGISNVMEAHTISIFPNPNDGNFKIEYLPVNGNKITISILNSFGQTVCSLPTIDTAAPLNIPVHLASQPAGIYFIRITDGSGTFYRKFIID